MDDGPKRPDPNESTEPLSRVIPPAREPLDLTRRPEPPPPIANVGEASPAAFVHRFGPKPFYLFARFVAFVIDGFGVTFVLATFAFNAQVHRAFPSWVQGEGGYVAIVVGAFLVASVFAFACEALFGTTIGKLVFALHVRTMQGRHVGPGPILLRTVLYPVDILFVGLVLAATTRSRQRLGDLLARTVVAKGSIGPFATVIGVALVIAIGYAQAAYAGGVGSVGGFASQTQQYAPVIFARATSILGAADESGAEPVASPSGSPTPNAGAANSQPVIAGPSDEPATAEPTAELPTEAPSAEPTEAPSAEPTEAPSAEPTEAPSADPSDVPSVAPTEEASAEPTSV